MNQSGKIIHIGATQEISEKFKKRVVWIETEGQYPQHLEFQFVQDKVTMLDSFAKGDQVDISFNLRGRGFTKQDGSKAVFNSLDGWKIAKVGAQQPMPPQQAPPQEDLDLPF